MSLPESRSRIRSRFRAITTLASSGNALADFQSQFTTAPSFDTSHGSVVNQRPGNGATGVAVDTSLTLFVNKPLNPATVPGAIHVSQNGQVVSGAVTLTNNGQTVQFVPAAPLQHSALVHVFVDTDTTATDTGGNTPNSYQGAFTVVADPATTAPSVVSSVPVNVIVGVAYTEPLNAATVTASTVTLRQNSTSGPLVAAAVSLDSSGTGLRLTPSAALAASTTYCASVGSGVHTTVRLVMSQIARKAVSHKGYTTV